MKQNNKLVKQENGEYILVNDAVNTIVAIEKEIKELKAKQDEYKEILLKTMEEKNILKLDAPELAITYIAPSDKETFDNKTFKEEHQDLYEEYVKMSPVKASIRIKVK